MKEIQLSKRCGKNKGLYVALVDDEDFESLNQFKWCAKRDGISVYSVRQIRINGRQRSHYMHRVIFGDKCIGFEIDHIDGNGLNNQKSNIRVCTHQQNCMNKRSHKNTSSKYKGVSFFKRDKNWSSSIFVDGKRVFLGYFFTEIEAAKAYDHKAVELFGEFAYLNFNHDGKKTV